MMARFNNLLPDQAQHLYNIPKNVPFVTCDDVIMADICSYAIFSISNYFIICLLFVFIYKFYMITKAKITEH